MRKVYRLENAQGHGPFHSCREATYNDGRGPYDQECSNFLKPHADPIVMMKFAGHPPALLKMLSSAQFVFGWSTQKEYRAFFKRGGQMACARYGFTQHIYTPDLRFDLSDGQVWFCRDPDFNAGPMLKELLGLLSKHRPK